MEFNTTYPCSGIENVRITKDSHNVDIEIIDATKNSEDDEAFEKYLGVIRGDVYDACHGVVDKLVIIKQWNDYVPILSVYKLVKDYIESRKFKNNPPVFILFNKKHEMAKTWLADLYFDANFKVADQLTYLENNVVMVNTEYSICDNLYKNVYTPVIRTFPCNKNKKESTKD